jgi:Domain of unknown function (DUF397)
MTPNPIAVGGLPAASGHREVTVVAAHNEAGQLRPARVDQNRGNGAYFPQSSEFVQWRKSSYSGYNGNCVEVADLEAGRVGVRDSKAGAGSPVLEFSRTDWAAFLVSVKDGRR